MRLSDKFLDRARNLNPKEPPDRIILDRGGNHHKTVPARDFVSAVTNHADQRKESVAESLLIVKRLADLGAVDSSFAVDGAIKGKGAIFQAFRGTGDVQGCHTMPCQLVMKGQYPHQLLGSDGQPLSKTYMGRVINLFARCTWSPKIINPIDTALDWMPEADFVTMFVDSIQAVLMGETPVNAYRELSWRKYRVLKDLCERVRDEPLDTGEAMFLMGALPDEQGMGMSRSDVQRLLTDRHFIEHLQDQREVTIDTYAEREQLMPASLLTGKLENVLGSENWKTDDK
jgi:hypothetical protein